MRRIASRENPLFRELLHVAGSARERRKREASLIEGVHLCEAYLARQGAPRLAVVSESALGHAEVGALLGQLAHDATVLSDALFHALSSVEHGIGIAFLIDTPRPGLPPALDQDCVFLDRLQDPGNVGTILRTCAAAGVGRVITAPGTAWCWSPKVLRAAMGAHFHLQIHEAVPWLEVGARVRMAVRAAAADASLPIYRADLRPPALWLFGHEGEGLAPALLNGEVQRMSIPQAPQVESLNVGVAAALCLYEQLRQRHYAGAPRDAAPRGSPCAGEAA